MEKLSPAEEKFETWRQTAGLFAGPVLFVCLWVFPTPSLSLEAHRLGAVLGLVIVFWVTEAIPIPVTALLGPGLCVLLGIGPAKAVLAPFADPIVFLFIGSFLIARAMMLHQLDRRFALLLFSVPWVGNSTTRLFIASGGAAALLSMWVSNTATTAMMLPIALGSLTAMGDILSAQSGKQVHLTRSGYAAGLMLMIAYGASIGGIGTPVGSPPNLIGIGMIQNMAGTRISFFQWMLLNVPLLIVMFIVLSLLLGRLHPPPVRTIAGAGEKIREMRLALGSWSRGQVCSLLSFLTAVFLWVLPGGVAVGLGTDSHIYKTISEHLNEGVSALLAASLLFILPVEWKHRRVVLSWKEAAQIDWGTILLFGGGLSLGKLMFDTRLAETLGTSLLAATGIHGVWGITALAIVFGVIVSETTSNTASASMVVPVMIALSQAAGVSPIPPALGATLGASFGFMLPVSTPPNAIVYGSGMVPIQSMLRAGIWFDVLGSLTIWVGLRMLCPLLGLS